MHPFLLAAAPVAGVVLVMAVAIGWDRLREPRRPLTRPIVVVDRRTYRDARRRIERLAAAGDWTRAWAGTVAICTWLNHEQHYGSPARRARIAAELADWTARRAEFNPTETLPEQPK